MNSSQGRLVIMWGHLGLLALIAVIVIAYWIDARQTSLRPTNLLMIQPAAVIALALVAIVARQCFVRIGPDDPAPEKESLSDLGKVAILGLSFAAFALSLELVGFDVATFLFMVIGLFVCGERRIPVNLGFSAVFTLLIIYGYGALIPFPFPLTVL